MDFYNRLKKLNESSTLLEYNRKDLRNFAGDNYAAKFFALRDKLQAPENDLGHWIKKGDVEAFKQFIDKWESGETKSKTQQKKDERMDGAELVFDDKGWKVYHVTKYEAAKQLGSGTTWCITGRYQGYENRGKEYFNSYIKDYKLDGGYYFMFDTMNKDSATGDYQKYCAGIDTSNRLRFLYNGMQDREISGYGIDNIPENRQVQPFEDKGIKIKYHNVYIIKDGVLKGINDQDRRYIEDVVIPGNVHTIGKFAFDDSYVTSVQFEDENSVKEIKSGAFVSCSSLANLFMPNSIETIGNGILLNCINLQKVKFSNAIKTIPSKTCMYCSNLIQAILPSGVESIDDNAFEGCGEVILDNCNAYAVEYAKRLGLKYVDPENGNVVDIKEVK